MSNTLYEITIKQKELIREIEYLEGELTPEMEEQLIITEKELQHKSVAYIEVIRHKEAFNTLIDAEIKRLQAMKKANNNVISRLKDNLLIAVKTFGKYMVGLTTFGTRSSKQVIVDDVNSLPEIYKTRKLTETANKKAIGDALKDGKEIEGCRIETNLNLKIN